MSIYESIGGADSVAAAVEQFYGRVLDDPLLAPYFRGADMTKQQRHMRAFLAVALGGPAIYEGRDMRAAHAGLGITEAAFDRVAEHLVATLDALGVAGTTIAQISERIMPLRFQVVGVAA